MDAAKLESTTTKTLQSVANEYKIYPSLSLISILLAMVAHV
jgi:hypothetical protein